MRTVRDESGKRYLLLAESSDSSRVRDPDTGDEQYLPNEQLEPVEGEAPLATAASGVPEPVRRVLTAVHSEQSLGLLIDLVERGPLPVVDILNATDLCESDLHGTITELRAAGLVDEAQIHGERGYEATETAAEAVAHLRKQA